MAEPEPKEQIVIKLDGVKVPLESLSPEVRADVDRRVKEARASYTSKYPTGKLRMNINVKVKTSAAAKKAGVPQPPRFVVEDDKEGMPWLVIAVLTLAVCGGCYLFVPAVATSVDEALSGVSLSRTKPALAPPPRTPGPTGSP